MAQLKLYNTLTRKKEIFKPIEKEKVRFYQCGPTVYWIQHIGNMRAMFWADFVVRSLKYLGYKVKFIRNYTDVGHLTSDMDEGEDKVEKEARQEGLSPQEIAQKYIGIFEEDVRALNITEPDYKPRASQFIKQIIEMIQVLLEKDCAYETDLAVYFDTSKAKDYTRLSGQKPDKNIAGAGKGKVIDPQKRNPADFSLWFFKAGQHKNALQFWPSPFKSPLVKNGQGFPGWHIECSVMNKEYLGKTLDIHMGGVEHISVHHTNEIAQSESANEVKFVNYWLHYEHLLVDNAKMAKSKGTGYSLSEIKAKGFNPLALRYLFLQAHYRSKQNFTWTSMKSARQGFDNLREETRRLGKKKGKIDKNFQLEFIKKLSDDFNSPQALALVSQLFASNLPKKDKLATLLDFDKVLGLKLDQIKARKATVPKTIQSLLKQREEARQNKNFKKADGARKQIEEKGYKIEDTFQGTKIKEFKNS